MKISLRELICGLVILLLTLLPGGAPRLALAEDDSRSALVALKERVQRFTLKNGLKVIMYRRGIAPVFSANLAVRVGGIDESVGSTGLAHMFEHMAFKGTSSLGTKDFSREQSLLKEQEEIAARSSGGVNLTESDRARWGDLQAELEKIWDTTAFDRELKKHGAENLNAYTSQEITAYFVDLPRPAFEFWCWLESERLRDPVLRQFYQERDVVMEERRMRVEDDPRGKLYEALLGIAFLRHQYRNPLIGYAADISRLTATRAEVFRAKHYVPSNMVITLVGDVDPQRDLELVRKYFEQLPGGAPPLRETLAEAPQQGEREFVLEETASPTTMIAYHKPVFPHPDDVLISVMLEILGGGRISPLHRELVQKRKLAAQVSYSEGPGQSFPNLMYFSLTPKAPHTNLEVLQAFDQVVEDFIRKGATAKQLAIAKRTTAKEYIDSLRTSNSLAHILGSTELRYGNWERLIDWYDAVMQVSEADVKRVARLYLQRHSRTVGRLEKKEVHP